MHTETSWKVEKFYSNKRSAENDAKGELKEKKMKVGQ